MVNEKKPARSAEQASQEKKTRHERARIVRKPSIGVAKKKSKLVKVADNKKPKPYIRMVKEAIKARCSAGDDVSGYVGITFIKNWIMTHYKIPKQSRNRIIAAIDRGVVKKILKQKRMSVCVNVKAPAAKRRRVVKKKEDKVSPKKKVSKEKIKDKKVKKDKKDKGKKKEEKPRKRKAPKKVEIEEAEEPSPKKRKIAKNLFPETPSPVKWHYFDVKWRPYAAEADAVLEKCYQDFKNNPGMLDVQAVQSGNWHYTVDFLNMKQTNIDHPAHTVRDIRRNE